MFIRVMSDIHLEFGDFTIPALDTDKDTILILAGDIGVGKGATFFLEKYAPCFREILYVLGNHEFYKHDYFKVIDYWTKEVTLPANVHVLHNDIKNFDGINFIGTTLWTNFDNEDYFAMQYARQNMSDYYHIKYAGKTFQPHNQVQIYNEAKTFLTDALQMAEGKKVVITHHLPTYAVVDEKFTGNRLNPAFVGICDELVIKANFWFFGHTHETVDKMLGNCRAICNPRGYHRYELNDNFNPNLLLYLQ